VQVITKCFPYIGSSSTSSLQTDNWEIPKHCKVFKIKIVLSTEAPSCLCWPNLFQISSNPPWSKRPYLVLQPHWSSEPSSETHILPHIVQSITVWTPPSGKSLRPFLCRNLPLHMLQSMGRGAVYPATVPARSILEALRSMPELGDESKPVSPSLCCAALSARHWWIWFSFSWVAVIYAGSSTGISLYMQDS